MARLLVIDTATPALSIALFDDGVLLTHDHRIINRGHAELLIPAIAALPDGGQCDAIAVDVGPGSFTGIRVGIAAAKGLALAWGVPASGYSSLALIAADAVRNGMTGEFTAAINGGHGQAFVQRFRAEAFEALTEAKTLELEDLPTIGPVAGPAQLAEHASNIFDANIDAQNYLALPASLTKFSVTPLYLRGADAKPMAEL